MRTLIKRLLKKFTLLLGGFYLSRIRSDMEDVLAHMKQQGFKPSSIIDVGVANGTSDLYEAFPEAQFVLVEPLSEYAPYMKSLQQNYKVHYEVAAAAATAGTVTLNVHPDLCGSSMLKEVEDSDVNGVERVVPSVTLDSLIERYSLQGPMLIKIDVQGGELDVLRGATKAMQMAEAVNLEVSLFGFFEGGPQFFDIVTFMKQNNFVVYEVYDGRNRLLDGALAQVDIMFVKENGLFKQNHAYATASQRKAQDKQIQKVMLPPKK